MDEVMKDLMRAKPVVDHKFVKVSRGFDYALIYDARTKKTFRVNITGARILDLCDGTHTIEDIARKLSEEFKGAEYTKVVKDVITFILALHKEGIIIIKTSDGRVLEPEGVASK